MGVVVPVLNDTIEVNSDAEIKVYHSLTEKLGNEFFTIYSFRWIALAQNTSYVKPQGEGDFVIIHPRRGILVLEIKGGGIIFKNGQWFSIDRSEKERRIKDPEKQASDTKFLLMEILKKHNIYNCPVFHAVWFPDIEKKDVVFPANLFQEIVFDKITLTEPAIAIEKAFDFWAARMQFMTANYKQEDIKKLLLPSVELVRNLRSDIQDLSKEYVKLTQEQATVLRGLEHNRRVAVIGRAGTGKTLLAIEKANRDLASGKKTLFLCFNSELAKHLRQVIQNKELYIRTIHSFALEYMRNYHPARIIGFDDDLLSTDDFHYLMDEFVDVAGNNDTFDSIIIDEAQDMKSTWLMAIERLLAPKGHWYVFYDPFQYLSFGDEYIDEFCDKGFFIYRLTQNMRNTDSISKLIMQVIEEPIDSSYLKGIKGRLPLFVIAPSNDYDFSIREEYANLIYEQGVDSKQITVLTLCAEQNSKVGKRTKNQFDQFTTARKFKGLENEILFIVDVNGNHFTQPELRRLLYVAMSRARSYVIVFVDANSDVPANFAEIVESSAKVKYYQEA